VAWLIFITPINTFLFRKKVRLGVINQETDTKLTAQTVDALTNVNAMHDYARRNYEMKRMKESIELRRTAGLANWGYSEKVLTLNSVLESLFVGGMIFSAIYLWSMGNLTAGDIILVVTLVISIRGNLGHLGQRFNEFAEQISQVKEGLTDILHEHDVVDAPGAKNLEVISGEISFNNISFKYETQDIFKNLTLKIKAGERVGLIGRSGAGKSTLMKLITRQYDMTGGEILIDGQNINSVKQESLRRAVTIVPQEPLLFHRSLKENILYGNLSASEEEIVRAARRAQAHNFIDSLPNKYSTLVGERGIKLSGGERQRVVIARAFLKNSKILLLDEATSALDSESEILIQEALKKLMEGKTVIAIAHRLSTLRAMDRLVVMDKGQVVEDGTHEELLEKGGIYAGLWTHQAGGFLQEE
jgi:ABC-type multidrug transport system fused ATPase/permease subunit